MRDDQQNNINSVHVDNRDRSDKTRPNMIIGVFVQKIIQGFERQSEVNLFLFHSTESIRKAIWV